MARFSILLILGALLYFSALASGEDKQVHALPPSNLRATNVGVNTVNLAWDDGAITCKDTLGGLSTYVVSSSPSGRQKCNVLVVAGTVGKSATCTGLLENTEYTFTVSAQCQKDLPAYSEDPSSGPSDPLEVTTQPSSPSAPESVSVVSSGAGTNKVVVSWVPGVFGCSYFLKESFVSWEVLDSSSPLVCDAAVSNSEATSTECELSDYTAGKIAVQLKCTTLSGKIQYFDYSTYAVRADPPQLTANPTWKSAKLQWTPAAISCEDAGSVSDGFYVKVVDSSDNVVCTGNASTSFECLNLNPGTDFTSYVSAVCLDAKKNSFPASSQFTTLPGTTAPVTDLQASGSGLSWNLQFTESDRPCSKYAVFEDPLLPQVHPYDLSVELEGESVTKYCSLSQSKTVKGQYDAVCTLPSTFIPGKFHNFSVAYRCKTPELDSVSYYDAPDSYINKVSDLVLKPAEPSWDSITIKWNDGLLTCADNAKEFLQYSITVESASTTLSFTSLFGEFFTLAEANTAYTFSVKTVCTDGLESGVAKTTVTSLKIPSLTPKSLNIYPESSESIGVLWYEKSQGANCEPIRQTFNQWKITDGSGKELFCTDAQPYTGQSTFARCFVDEGVVSLTVAVSIVCDNYQSEPLVSNEISIPKSVVEHPSGVTTDVTATSVKVTWKQEGSTCSDAGTAFNAWIVQVDDYSVTPFEGTNFTSFSANLYGLSPNTNYTGYLWQDCVDKSKNSAQTVFSFKTGLASAISAPLSVSARGSDALAFTGVYNRVFVDIIQGEISCEQAGSTFTDFEVQTSALNTDGEGTYQTTSCTRLSQTGITFTYRCDVMPGTKYNVRAAATCARVNLKTGYTEASSSFTTLDENTKSTKFEDVLSKPSTFSGDAQVQMTSGTFSSSDGITGISFGFVQATKRSAATQPENTTDIGNLEFVLDALTPNGPRPSGFTQGPIVFRFNVTNFGISLGDVSNLKLYYVDMNTSAWVSAEDTCEPAFRQNWVTSDGIWVVATCHLSQFKAFYDGIKPVANTTVETTTEAPSVTQASQTQNNVISGNNTEEFVGITTGALIGAIIACILGVLLIAAIVLLVLWRRHQNKLRKEDENQDTEQFEPHVPQGGELGKSVSEHMSRDAESSAQFDKVQRLGLESDEDSAWSSDEENNKGTRV